MENGKSLSYNYQKTLETHTINGATLREALEELFDSDQYDRAVDADASNLVLATGDESRGALVADVFNTYRRSAKKEFIRTNREAARILAAAEIKKAAGPELENVQTEFLLSEEGDRLLLDLGIDIEEVADKIERK
jgi:hypothetical protein